MASALEIVTAVCTVLIRAIAYLFLRWVPGHHFVPAFYTLQLLSLGAFSLQAASLSRPDDRTEKQPPPPPPPAAEEARPLLEDPGNGSRESTIPSKPKSRRGPPVWKCLLWGLPSSDSRLLNVFSFGVNIVLSAMVSDLIFRQLWYPSHDLSFTRVGYVSDQTASLLLREPDITRLPIYVSIKEAPPVDISSGPDPTVGIDDGYDSGDWKVAAEISSLSNDSDYTYALQLNHLRASTTYKYSTSNAHNGTFTTAPPIGHARKDTNKFSFITSSCIKPHFPYTPLDHPLTIPGFKHLAKWIPSLRASFMLFQGDFIYTDVPHSWGTDVESYRRQYRQVYASPDWPAVSNDLPWIHVIDDHEIENDWDKNITAPYPNAMDPWTHYQHVLNPPPLRENTTFYTFDQSLASFFMMDTRRYRTSESVKDPESPSKSMLGPKQLSSLFTFLRTPPPPGIKWKIIISSVPFTRNWRINGADTWAGYLYERQLILEAMWDASSSGTGVVILSGDRHEFAATSFPPPEGGKWDARATVHEFSTSPLNMFYLPLHSYWEVPGQRDVCIKYLPHGNSKFGVVEIENVEGGEQALLRFRLFVDGEEAWNHVLTNPSA